MNKEQILSELRRIEQTYCVGHGFKQYSNYYLPHDVVKNSTRLLSFGVNNDTKFENLVCEDNDAMQVKLFDPSPVAIDHWNSHDWSRKKQMQFFPIAYAKEDAIKKFYVRKGVWGASYSLHSNHLEDHEREDISVECLSLKSCMNKVNWDHVDIIKTDIEGVWEDFSNELLTNNTGVKYWITEIELNLGNTRQEGLQKMETMCKRFTDAGWKIYINRVRKKAMSELIFESPQV